MPDGLQFGDGLQHTEVRIVVGLGAELGRVGEQADLAEPVDDLGADAGLLDQLRERQLAAVVAAEEPLQSGAIGVENSTDRREREALRLEVPDLGEPIEVLGAVELVPAGPLGRGQQLLPGVVADGVDGDAGPLGELVDPPGGRQNRPPGEIPTT